MTKNITLSVAVVVPLVGIGGVVGSVMRAQLHQVEPQAIVTIQPLEMQRSADVRKLPELEISDLF